MCSIAETVWHMQPCVCDSGSAVALLQLAVIDAVCCTHSNVAYQGMESLTAHKAEKSEIDSCMTSSVVIMARLLVRLTLNSEVPSRFCFCLAAPLAAALYQNNAQCQNKI